MIIDMVADPVCPWCYIGKRSLDRAALALSYQYDLTIRYRPFFLAANLPAQGIPRVDYLQKKFERPDYPAEFSAAIEQAARQVGLSLDTGRPQIMPNTLNAQRLLRWAHIEGDHLQLMEEILSSFWHHGDNIGDIDILAPLAQKTGMNKHQTRSRLESGEDIDDLHYEATAIRDGGVTSVPTFIVNEAAGFAGALPPDELLAQLQLLAQNTTIPA